MAASAEDIMKARQKGISMATMLDATYGTGESVREVSVGLVEDAYSMPQHHTDSAKQRAVEDFRDTFYLRVYREIL